MEEKDYGLRIADDSPVWMKPQKTVWFIIRQIGTEVRYLKSKAGRLRTWGSAEKAKIALGKLPENTLS